MQDDNRAGNFTSSSIYKLLTLNRKGDGLGAPGLKYVKQKNYEKKLGRCIDKEVSAKPNTWGSFVELRAFNLLGLDYRLVSKNRLFHPIIDCWNGAPDLVNETTEGDVKCPYSLEMFCDKIAALEAGLEVYKEEFPEDYWQHISNAILLEKNGQPITHFEVIIYCPYQSEIQVIREMASNFDDDQNKIKWLDWVDEAELPYLIEGKGYQNLSVFRFEVSESDKQLLTQKVLEAQKLLIKI